MGEVTGFLHWQRQTPARRLSANISQIEYVTANLRYAKEFSIYAKLKKNVR